MHRTIAVALAVAFSETLWLQSAAAVARAKGPPAETAEAFTQARSLIAAAKYAKAEVLLREAAQTSASGSGERGEALDLLGALYTALASYDEADDCFREAAGVFERLEGRASEHADALTHWAKALQLRADYTAAKSRIEESFAVVKQGKLEGSGSHAKAVAALADLEWANGKSEQAHDHFLRAIELFQTQALAQSAECAAAQNNLGLLCRSHDLARADKLIRAAMATRKALFGERHPDYANSLTSLASVLKSEGKWTESEPLLRQALEIRKQTLGEDHPEYASTVNALANLYRARGDYLRAEPEARRAAEICHRALGDRHPFYAAALNNLALVYYDEANYVDAEAAFLKAIDIYDATLDSDHRHRLAVCHNLAELYEAEGDHRRAKRLFDQEGEARRRSATGDTRGYALWLVGMARLLRKERKFDEANTLLGQALEWLTKVGGPDLDRAMMLEELAMLNLATANLAKDRAAKNKRYWSADAQLKQVIEIRSRILGDEHPDYATALENQASLCQTLRYFAAAETRYQIVLDLRTKALGTNHPDCAAALANRAGARREQGKDAAAAADYKQALNIIRKHLNATAMAQTEQQQLAMVQTARLYLDEYLSLMTELSAPSEELYAEALAWKGAVSRRQQTMRDMRRALEDKNPEFAELYQELEAATRQFAQLAHSGPAADDQAMRRREFDRWDNAVERLERELAAKSADFRREMQSRSRTPDDIRQALPDDVALVDLLEYWRIPTVGMVKQAVSPSRRLIAFVVRRGRPTELIDLGPAKAIERAVNAWLAGLEQPSEKDLGLRLRQLLWAPLERHVSDAKTVLISPDGATAWLPWGALPAKEPYKFLIELQAFVMLPVPQMLPDLLAADANSSGGEPTLLVAGDIDYGAAPGKADGVSLKRSAIRGDGDDLRYGWRRLAAAKAEISHVADAFSHAYPKAPAVTSLDGQSPTEGAVRAAAPRRRFLHFATHGFFAPPQVASAARSLSSADLAPGERAARSAVAGYHPGLLSGIVLAGANRPETLEEDDGILTALEIEQLGLSGVELVTLSACQTGLGNTLRGEGLLGLQRAFQIAGARSALTSLWSVDDEQTARLMALFYENLWKKKLSRAEALRRAQIDMLNADPNRGPATSAKRPEKDERGMKFSKKRLDQNGRLPPRYWAAFVLSGDWR